MRIQTAAVLPVTRRKVIEVRLKSTTVLSVIRWYVTESGAKAVKVLHVGYSIRQAWVNTASCNTVGYKILSNPKYG